MSDVIAYSDVKQLRISPDGTRVVLKDDTMLFFRPCDLEIEMPNGDLVTIGDAVMALQLKGYVPRPYKPIRR